MKSVLLLKHYNEPDILYRAVQFITNHKINVLHAADTHLSCVKPGELSIIQEMEKVLLRCNRIDKSTLDEIIKYELERNSSEYHQQLRNNAITYINYAYNILLEKKIDCLIVWNGMPLLSSCFIYVAQQLGIKIVYCENGPLPNTIAVDISGINFKCSLSLGYINDLSMLLDNVKFEDHLCHIKVDYMRKSHKDRKVKFDIEKHLIYLKHCLYNYKRFPEICVVNIFKLAFVKRINKIMYRQYINENPPRGQYIFFPFQVYDDTQILIYSKFKSMEEVVYLLLDQIQKYNKSKKYNLKLAIKQHPGDLGRKTYINLFRELKKDYNDLVYLVEGSIESIISNALCTVTINSSVGVESLLLGTPVITLGQAFYNNEQIVEIWDEQVEFQSCLENAIKNDFNWELTNKYLNYYYHRLLVRREPELVANKLMSLI